MPAYYDQPISMDMVAPQPGSFEPLPDIARGQLDDVNYRSLVLNMNQVPPGGRGGPGPSKLCDAPEW